MSTADDYCRQIEAHLCRKNDGHLIRIVGPAFEQVSGWAREGIPLKVALAGIDRYFERYYRKGPRRRPVRVEFCEADIRDAFDAWRRAVGVVTEQDDERPRRGSLAAHLEQTIARLTTLRASSHGLDGLREILEKMARELDALQGDARRARGEARDAILSRLTGLDRELIEAALASVSDVDRARLATEADHELAPFRARLAVAALEQSRAAAITRLVREELGLPKVAYD